MAEAQSFTAEQWERFLHGIFENHEAMMLLIEPETGRILQANRTARAFHGYDSARLAQTTLGELSLCGTELLQNMESVLRGEGKKIACSHKTADGKIRMVEAYPSVVNIDGRRFFFVILHDVTAYKQAEEKYGSLFRRIMDGVYRSTHAGKFVDINPAMVKMFGYASEEEMKGIDIKSELYFEPEERGSHILDTGKEETEIYRMRRKDGSEIWVEDHGWYVHDERGEILYHEGILRDVTERKRAQDLWGKYAERLQILYQTSRKLSASLGKQHIYETACESVRQLIPCDSIHISSFERRTNMITLAYGLHDGQVVNPANYPPIPLEPEGKGIQSEAIRSGKPQLIRDYQARLKNVNTVYYFDENGERVESLPADGDIPRSALVAPMIAENQVIGAIEVLSYQPNVYSENDLQLLTALASQTAVALINSDLFQQLQRENRERRQAENSLRARTRVLETLFAISSYISWSGYLENEEDVLPKILRELERAAEMDALAILSLNAAGKEVTVSGATGELSACARQTFPAEEDAGGSVYKSRQTYQTADLSSDPNAPRNLEAFSRLGPAVFVPILAGEHFLGVLLAARKKGAPAFAEETARLLTATGELLGNALNRMRLDAETLRRLERLQTLRAVDQAIASSLDLHITLNILLKHAVGQLGVDAASIFLLHPHLQTLQFAAGQGFHTENIKKAEIGLNDQFAGRCATERARIEIHGAEQVRSNPAFFRLWAEEGFVQYACVPLIAKGEVKGVMEIYRRSAFSPDEEWYEFLETLAGQAAISIDNGQMFHNLQNANMELAVAYDATIEGWSRALDLRDKETEGHTQRVTDLTLRLAKAMRVSDKEILHIRRGALLHDIGKMGVPDEILLKPGPLTPKEWKVMKQHPVFALKMLQPIRYLRQALDIPYCHHERWDGSGYPRGLKGEEIPLAARIFAVADVYDALTSSRPYRRAWSSKKALQYIQERAGAEFDPQVVDAFLKMMKREARRV